MEALSEMKLAVLVDADNATQGDFKVILSEITKYGVPIIKRAYGDWSRPDLARWKDVLLENGAISVQQYAYTAGKNATDAAMIIDAMDILHDGRVDGFVLVSSDSDFTPLALRLRESGVKVYGIGERKTPKPFITACDKFIYVDILRPAPPSPPPTGKSTGQTKPIPTPTPAKRKPSSATVEFIAACIAETSNENGLSNLASLGSLMNKNRPDFDCRNYGYAKLSKFLQAIERFEVKLEKNNVITVRDRLVK